MATKCRAMTLAKAGLMPTFLTLVPASGPNTKEPSASGHLQKRTCPADWQAACGPETRLGCGTLLAGPGKSPDYTARRETTEG